MLRCWWLITDPTSAPSVDCRARAKSVQDEPRKRKTMQNTAQIQSQMAVIVPALKHCQCDNCGWSGSMDDLRAQLDEVECGLERLDPGSVVPAGECPKCGAFAYIDDGKQRLLDASLEILCSLQSCAEMLEELLRTAASNDQADAIDLVLTGARAAIAKATGKAQP